MRGHVVAVADLALPGSDPPGQKAGPKKLGHKRHTTRTGYSWLGIFIFFTIFHKREVLIGLDDG